MERERGWVWAFKASKSPRIGFGIHVYICRAITQSEIDGLPGLTAATKRPPPTHLAHVYPPYGLRHLLGVAMCHGGVVGLEQLAEGAHDIMLFMQLHPHLGDTAVTPKGLLCP